MIHVLDVPLARRALHLWFRLTRGMTLGVRIAAFDRAGRVALVRHTYVPGWHLPGGGVERGETALESASRELLEETGIAIGPEPRLHGVFLNAAASRRDHVVLYVAEARDFPETFAPGDREIAERGAFHPDRLPEGVTGATRRRLDEIAGRRAVSPLW